MNYQDSVYYDPVQKQYFDRTGYVVDGFSSKALKEGSNYDNKIDIVGGPSGTSPTISVADYSKDADVSLNLETKGTGVVRSSGGILTNTLSDNQIRLTTDDTGFGTVSVEGLDDNIDLKLTSKGTGAVIATNTADASNTSGSWPTATAPLRILGGAAISKTVLLGGDMYMFSGKALYLNTMQTTAAVKTSYIKYQSSGSTLDGLAGKDGPRIAGYSGGEVGYYNGNTFTQSGYWDSTGVTGKQLWSTYGAMYVKATATQGISQTTPTDVTYASVVNNSFGSGYWLTNNTFKNISGKQMKVTVNTYSYSGSNAGNSGDYDIRVMQADGITTKYRAGRRDWTGASNMSYSCNATFVLEVNEYFTFKVYFISAGVTLTTDSQMWITQIP